MPPPKSVRPSEVVEAGDAAPALPLTETADEAATREVPPARLSYVGLAHFLAGFSPDDCPDRMDRRG